MASWAEVEAEAPELAATARAFFDAHAHKTIATLRRDGSPRISGTECEFVDGELRWGSMLDARKAQDLLRDPRFAIHSASQAPPDWKGDARISGTAREVSRDGHHVFEADISEVMVVRKGDPADHLVIEVWTLVGGCRRFRR